MRLVGIFRKGKKIAEGELVKYEDDADQFMTNVEWWAVIKITASSTEKLGEGLVYTFRRPIKTNYWMKRKDRHPCLGAVQIREGENRL
jgi:3-methyladenine DNA glycosylase AlkD